MTFFSTSERLEIGEVPFVSTNAKPTRSEALEYYRRVAMDNKINVHLFEEVTDIKSEMTDLKKEKGYIVFTNKNRYIGMQIIIATGFYDIPYLLNVPGEELAKVRHYYKDPHFYSFQKFDRWS
jgi:cation diffusion facilitator CzcD-associated flavoprotein CzcO